MTKKALGRGLDALISGGVVRSVAVEPPHVEVAIAPPASTTTAVQPLSAEPAASDAESFRGTGGDVNGNAVRHIGIDAIERSPFQPRTEFDSEQLRELADSIKQRGVIQPLLVRPIKTKAAPNAFGASWVTARLELDSRRAVTARICPGRPRHETGNPFTGNRQEFALLVGLPRPMEDRF